MQRMVQAVCKFLWQWAWFMKRLKHGRSQVWGGHPCPEATTVFRWAKSRLGSRLRCSGWSEGTKPREEWLVLLGCAGPAWWWGSTSSSCMEIDTPRPSGFEGAGGWGGQRDRPAPLVPLCFHHGSTITAVPLYKTAGPQLALRPHGHIRVFNFACLSPGTSCGHSYNMNPARRPCWGAGPTPAGVACSGPLTAGGGHQLSEMRRHNLRGVMEKGFFFFFFGSVKTAHPVVQTKSIP